MKIDNNINSLVTVILLLAFILLVKIGSEEVQPWDEGLYAIRAQSILQNEGAFFDQSEFSPGGLYSATYPPLSVWAIAGSMAVFGENEFALRFFSALCSLAALVLISLIAKRITRDDYWIAITLSLFVSLAWNTFSRQGMTDVPLVFFFLLCFYSVIRGMESESRKEIVFWAFVFMIGFSCALMTKIIKSLLPLLFLGMLFLGNGFKKQKLVFGIMGLAGVFIGSLWYIYMAVQHGQVFTGALLVPHIYSAVEGNTKGLGIFYYINQLIISNPLFLFTIVFAVIFIFRRKWIIFNNDIKDYIYLTSLVWFAGVFLLFSLSVTKLYHYTIYMIPSLAILTVIFYENSGIIKVSPKLKLFINLSVFASLAWSLSMELRTDFKQVINGEFSPIVVLFLVLCAAIVFLSLFLKLNSSARLLDALYLKLPLIILTVLFFRIVFNNSVVDTGFSHGARQITQSLTRFQANKFIYVYHSFTPADSLNPQLAWYSGDYMRGWGKTKSYIPVGLNRNTFDIKKLRIIDEYPDYPLIYNISDDKELSLRIIRDIMETRNPVRKEKNYVLFGAKRYDRKKGIII